MCGFEHRVLRVPSGSRGPVCYPVEPRQPEGLAMAFTEVRTQRPVDRAAARIRGAGGPEDGVCLKVVNCLISFSCVVQARALVPGCRYRR